VAASASPATTAPASRPTTLPPPVVLHPTPAPQPAPVPVPAPQPGGDIKQLPAELGSLLAALPPPKAVPGPAVDVDAVIDILINVDLSPAGTAAGDAAAAAGRPYPRLRGGGGGGGPVGGTPTGPVTLLPPRAGRPMSPPGGGRPPYSGGAAPPPPHLQPPGQQHWGGSGGGPPEPRHLGGIDPRQQGYSPLHGAPDPRQGPIPMKRAAPSGFDQRGPPPMQYHGGPPEHDAFGARHKQRRL